MEDPSANDSEQLLKNQSNESEAQSEKLDLEQVGAAEPGRYAAKRHFNPIGVIDKGQPLIQ